MDSSDALLVKSDSIVASVLNSIIASLLLGFSRSLFIKSILSLFTLSNLSPVIEPEVSIINIVSVFMFSFNNSLVSTWKVILAFPFPIHSADLVILYDPGLFSS